MPEGPLGAPRVTNFGPVSRSTEDEIRQHWDECPPSGKPNEICKEIKLTAITILEGQGFYAPCDTLAKINSGGCASVAKRVYQQVDGLKVYEAGEGDHVWLYYDGKHYDAEKPTGVSDPLDLPFFARIPPKSVLSNAQMAAEAEGEEIPQSVDEVIRDVTSEKDW